MLQSCARVAFVGMTLVCVGCRTSEETPRDALAESGNTAAPSVAASPPSSPQVPAVQSPTATAALGDGRGASVRVDASGRRVLDDGHGRVVVADGKQSTATDGKSTVVTTPTGTKATSGDGRTVQINKDGTVTVPGVGTVRAP